MVKKVLTPEEQKKLAAQIGRKARETSPGARGIVKVDKEGNVKAGVIRTNKPS